MRISVLTVGAIASILSLNAYASSVVTSQTYVDNQDALKQDKITAGTTGNVVLYNGTQNGQTQFTGRAIYDGATAYNSSTDANKLITAGAVNTMAPELPTGDAGYVVTYDSNGDIGGSRPIDYDTNWFDSDGGPFAENDPDALVTIETISGNFVYDLATSDVDNGIASATGVMVYAQPKITPGTTGSVVVYNGTAGDSRRNHAVFTEKAISNAPVFNNGALTNGNDIASISAVETKQNKMTCTRWIDNAAHTDVNCLLWNMAN